MNAMTKPRPDYYRPSNGSEGEAFEDKFCENLVQNPSAGGHRYLDGRTHDELPWVIKE